MNQKMQYQKNQMNQTGDISQKNIFGPNSGPIWAQFGPKWANMSPKNFKQTKISQLTVKHHCNQSKYAISDDSNEPNSRYQPKQAS